jgi:hypothetical protein
VEIKITPSEIKDPSKDTRPMTEAEAEIKRLEYELKNRVVGVFENVVSFIGAHLASKK